MFDPSWKVLVVDDMNTMRKIVIKMLQIHGFTSFVEAADGIRGWEALLKANPPIDLILSDINMPNLNGIEFLKRVRGDKRFERLPFLFLSAEAELKTVSTAIANDVTGYLVKPVSPAELEKKLKALPHRKAG